MGAGPWWLAFAVYFPMALVGAGWAYASRGSFLTAPGSPWLSPNTTLAGAYGLSLALALSVATIAVTRVLVARTSWAKNLHLTLRAALGTPSTFRVIVLAVLSAVSEELLFRSAMMPVLGLVGSSVLFGLVHLSPRDTYLAWSLWAAVMGLLFGLLFQASGWLLAPIVAHALINYENMQYIIHYDPTPLDMDRRRKPRRFRTRPDDAGERI
jgi:membrane protease YdiL (CAAX protease family)